MKHTSTVKTAVGSSTQQCSCLASRSLGSSCFVLCCAGWEYGRDKDTTSDRERDSDNGHIGRETSSGRQPSSRVHRALETVSNCHSAKSRQKIEMSVVRGRWKSFAACGPFCEAQWPSSARHSTPTAAGDPGLATQCRGLLLNRPVSAEVYVVPWYQSNTKTVSNISTPEAGRRFNLYHVDTLTTTVALSIRAST